MTASSSLPTPAERAAVRAPIERARTLPRRVFTDPGFFAFERDHLLAKSWLAVAFASDLAEPGSVLPLTALDLPLLLTRDGDGRLHAFHNVCPYDGCEVAIEPAVGTGAIVTPYHGWRYGLDGRLLEAGYFDGTPAAAGVDLGTLDADLRPVPLVEWMRTLFVWPVGAPEPFDKTNAAVLAHFADLDTERLVIGADGAGEPLVRDLTIAANWKTVYENYSPNVYHESFVHAMYRRSPHSPRVDGDGRKTYTEVDDPSGFLGLTYDNRIGASFYGESPLPPVRLRDGTPSATNTIANMYPNWVVTVLGDCARMALFLPESAGAGTQRVATLFDRDAAADDTLADARERATRLGIIAREEDNRICESIQRARRSPAVESQFYAPFWDAMHHTLSNLVLDRIEAAERALCERS